MHYSEPIITYTLAQLLMTGCTVLDGMTNVFLKSSICTPKSITNATSEIPQGKYIRTTPIFLFLIYINDLLKQVLFLVLFPFADDTTIIISISDNH